MEFSLIGRAAGTERLMDWLTVPAPWDPVRIVTGSRGCGKSWLTAWTVMAADTHADAGEYVPGDIVDLPSAGTIDLALDCRHRTAAELSTALSRALLPDREPTAGKLPLIELARAAERRGRAFTVALTDIAQSGRLRGSDEAAKVLEQLVLPLVNAAEQVRLSLKPSRAPVRLLMDLPPDLAAALSSDAALPDSAVLNLDSDPFEPPRREFTSWVEEVLAQRSGADLSAEQRARTAQLICERAWPNFLFAETLAIDFRSRTAEALPRSLDELPRSLAHAWHERITVRGEAQDRLDMVAAPVMLAQGELGMPESLCAEAVSALIGRAYSAQDLRRHLDALTPYVSAEWAADPRDPETSVLYVRPSDEALADAVRAAYGSSSREAERRVAAVLTRHLPSPDPADWLGPYGEPQLSPEQEYVTAGGLGHAVAASVLDDWTQKPSVCLLAEPEALAEALRRTPAPASGPAALRRSALTEERRLFAQAPAAANLGERAARLRLAAAVVQDRSLMEWIDSLGLRLPWTTSWVHWRPVGAFDPAVLDPQWPGPVRPEAARQVGKDTLLRTRSAVDGTEVWWRLADGAVVPAPEAVDEHIELLDGPAHNMPVAVPALADEQWLWQHSVDVEHTIVSGPGGLLCLGPTATHEEPPPSGAPAPYAPSPARPSGRPLREEDLSQLFTVLGGPVRTPPERLAELASLSPDARQLLGAVGLPLTGMWFDGLEDCVPELQTLADFLPSEYPPAPDQSELLVFCYLMDEDEPVCLDPVTGQVLAHDGSSRLAVVNSSLSSFVICLATCVWGLAFTRERHPGERAAFESFLLDELTRIDPVATAPENPVWPRLVTDASIYTLELE
ncbi:SUKH-4 family immunity protein [Streptomyces sp. NPDC057694]|uniref:SUKH-4 family immunity protein n=1 Tax=Streptomyces sp. NPDC057694 TaxID=3346216 RepID=UPI0036B145BB